MTTDELYAELWPIVHVFPKGHRITLRNYRVPIRARHNKHTGPYYWTVPDVTTRREGIGFYMDSGRQMDSHGSALRLRIEDANEHLQGTRLANINGYYTDEYGDSETLQPIVARLPKSRGYLAGWTMGEGMASALDMDLYETLEDAARAAHDMAERDAEKEREYQESQGEAGNDA